MSMRTTQICPVLPALSGRLDNLNMSVRVRSGPFWIKYLLLKSKFRSSTLSASDRRDVVGADSGWNGPPLKGGPSLPPPHVQPKICCPAGSVGLARWKLSAALLLFGSFQAIFDTGVMRTPLGSTDIEFREFRFGFLLLFCRV